MLKFQIVLWSLALITCSCFSSCDKDDTPAGDHVFRKELINASNLLESVELTSAQLTDGSTVQCYKLVFKSNPVPNGPYCPPTVNDIGGLGIYDGITNPGFQVLKASLWNAMETDGYDIIDPNGNINKANPGAGGSGSGGGSGGAACLEATPDDNLKLTFYIPAVPKASSSAHNIQTVELVGVSKDGIPITGPPPSVVSGPPGMGGGAGGSIPALDPCGGHMDPFGYYHLHFGPEEMNNVLAAQNITEVTCSNFTQSETALIGFAKDGYPIYASKDSDGSLPSDLDACQGHFGPTADYPDGVYHYHVSSTKAPNLPPCLQGVPVDRPLTYE